MLENIKGFCCHYGGFCEKENFIKTTYIYNKISKQISIALGRYIIILLPGRDRTMSVTESTTGPGGWQPTQHPPDMFPLERNIKEISTGLMRINLIAVCSVCS